MFWTSIFLLILFFSQCPPTTLCEFSSIFRTHISHIRIGIRKCQCAPSNISQKMQKIKEPGSLTIPQAHSMTWRPWLHMDLGTSCRMSRFSSSRASSFMKIAILFHITTFRTTTPWLAVSTWLPAQRRFRFESFSQRRLTCSQDMVARKEKTNTCELQGRPQHSTAQHSTPHHTTPTNPKNINSTSVTLTRILSILVSIFGCWSGLAQWLD